MPSFASSAATPDSSLLSSSTVSLPSFLRRLCGASSEVRCAQTAPALAALFLVALTFLAGCSSGGSNSSGGKTPSIEGSVTITSPAAGATLKSLPATVSFTFSGGATPASSAVTINGADISKSLVPGTARTYTATLGSSFVYIGSNRIAAAVGVRTSSSTFTYDPTTPDFRSPAVQETTSSGAPISDVVGIQTRVQVSSTADGNPVWGIQVGPYNFTQPITTVHNGLQVVVLRRYDLSSISNSVYNFDNPDEILQFGKDIIAQPSKVNACGTGGCLQIIQSLSTAVPSCSDNACLTSLAQLSNIGGSLTYFFAAHTPSTLANVAYSFIGNVGNVGLAPGMSFERLTCSASTGCPADFAPNPTQVNAGVVPNLTDGHQPSLNSSGSTGTQSISATTNLPAMTVSNNGAIGGELILDNNNAYTFSYTEPPVHYAMGRDPNNTNVNALELRVPSKGLFRFADGSTRMYLNSNPLPANPDGSEPGGFQLAIFDATTFNLLLNNTYVVNPSTCIPPSGSYTCTAPDGSPLYPLIDLQYHIAGFSSRRAIFFLQSLGNLHHECPPDQQCEASFSNQNAQLPIQDTWNATAQAVQNIGGTFATFDSLDNPALAKDPWDQYTPSTTPRDDYQLVGQWWLPNSGVPNPYGKEESSQINRQTVSGGGGARMTGLLEKERDGYYRATLESSYGEFFPKSANTFFAAPLLPPVNWPLTGPADSAGVKAAYSWTSQQLLKCISNCSDLRGAYSNLNQDPAIWLAFLVGLQAPADCASACPLGFSSADFQTVQAQLETEIQYVANVRQYQGNLLNLLQAEQSNRGLILQQEVDALQANTTIDLSTTSFSGQNWRSYTTDAFHLLGPVASLGVPSAIGLGFIATDGIVAVSAPYLLPAVAVASAIGVAALDVSAKKTNQVNGAPIEQQEHELYAAGQLAGQLTDQYADILITVGHDFNRIYADWGRLSAIGSTITNNGLSWSTDATGKLLKTFDLTTRRQFLRTLLPAGYTVSHFSYASPGLNPGFGTDFLPDGPRNYEGNDGNYIAFDHCNYYQFMQNQAAGNPTDPSTRQSFASYMFIPGAPISGPGLGTGTVHRYPFDVWWDLWTIQESQVGANDPCADTNNMPMNGLFISTGMFQPLDPDNPNALGFYKVWLFQRDLARSVFEPYNNSAGDGRNIESANFWKSQIFNDQKITWDPALFTPGYPLSLDPRSY